MKIAELPPQKVYSFASKQISLHSLYIQSMVINISSNSKFPLTYVYFQVHFLIYWWVNKSSFRDETCMKIKQNKFYIEIQCIKLDTIIILQECSRLNVIKTFETLLFHSR